MSATKKKKYTQPASKSIGHRLKGFLVHPWIAVIPVVLLLWFGWQFYLDWTNQLNTPQHTLLPNGDFEKLENGLPGDWKLSHQPDTKVTTGSPKGYVKGKALGIYIRDHKSGDITFETPQVKIEAGKKYLFKGYYFTSVPFDLLVRSHFKDGTTKLEDIREYPANGDPWSTVSYAFVAQPDVQAIEMVYRLGGNGDLLLDNTYLEERTEGIYIPSDKLAGANLILNGDLSQANGQNPKDWVNYRSGNNNTTFAYITENNHRFVRTEMTNFKDGEAKWQYLPLKVKQGQSFDFAMDYKSTMPVELTAEYELVNGTRQYDTAVTLKPASEWTRTSTSFEAPKDAVNMFVSAVVHSNGTLTSGNYFLHEKTRRGINGQTRYDRPLISVTFDDGWQSSYHQGAAILDQFGFKGTNYINSSTINTGTFMNQSQLEDLVRRGHQLASHGDEHVDMTALNAKRLQRELEVNKNYLQKRFRITSQDFATPYGKSDAEVQYIARQLYRSHRGTSTGLNTKQNFDPHDLKVIFVTKDTPLQTIQEGIEEAQQYNGWLILVYHRIEPELVSSTTVTPTTFVQHLEMIRQKGIAVETVEQALKELQAQ